MIKGRLLGIAMASCIFAGSLPLPVLGMTFSKHPNESADENAIVASGDIVPDDAFRFQTYLSKLPKKSLTSLYLNSTGGSVQGAMALGRIVNEVKVRTYVTDPLAKCLSACTNIFLAGRDGETGKPYRVKGSNCRLGFHNFVPVLQDKSYTAKDAIQILARAQTTIYDIANYFQEIDADLELLGLGLKQKDIYYLQNQDALRYRIHVLDAQTQELVRYESYMRFVKP